MTKQRIAYDRTLVFDQDQVKPPFLAEAITTEGIDVKRQRRFSFMGG
jgi:hypothetical protein